MKTTRSKTGVTLQGHAPIGRSQATASRAAVAQPQQPLRSSPQAPRPGLLPPQMRGPAAQAKAERPPGDLWRGAPRPDLLPASGERRSLQRASAAQPALSSSPRMVAPKVGRSPAASAVQPAWKTPSKPEKPISFLEIQKEQQKKQPPKPPAKKPTPPAKKPTPIRPPAEASPVPRTWGPPPQFPPAKTLIEIQAEEAAEQRKAEARKKEVEARKKAQEALDREFTPAPTRKIKTQSSKKAQKEGDATTTATYKAESAHGESHNDERTKQILGNRAPLLWKCLKQLKNHHETGTICACAEPNAIAQLLEEKKPDFRAQGACSSWLREVRVAKTSLIGELIEPCRNCSQWLEPAAGSRSYKIKKSILEQIDRLEQERQERLSTPKADPVPLISQNQFEVLRNVKDL